MDSAANGQQRQIEAKLLVNMRIAGRYIPHKANVITYSPGTESPQSRTLCRATRRKEGGRNANTKQRDTEPDRED